MGNLQIVDSVAKWLEDPHLLFGDFMLVYHTWKTRKEPAVVRAVTGACPPVGSWRTLFQIPWLS